jgi:hypothetical protein
MNRQGVWFYKQLTAKGIVLFFHFFVGLFFSCITCLTYFLDFQTNVAFFYDMQLIFFIYLFKGCVLLIS